MSISVLLTMCTVLYRGSLELFHLLWLKLYTPGTTTPSFLLLHSIITILLFVSMSLIALDNSYIDGIMHFFIFNLLVSLSIMSPVLPVLWHGTEFSFFLKPEYIPLCIYILYFISIHPSMGCFNILDIANNGTMNMGVQISLHDPVFSSFWVYIQRWNCWLIWYFCFEFFEEYLYCFP